MHINWVWFCSPAAEMNVNVTLYSDTCWVISLESSRGCCNHTVRVHFQCHASNKGNPISPVCLKKASGGSLHPISGEILQEHARGLEPVQQWGIGRRIRRSLSLLPCFHGLEPAPVWTNENTRRNRKTGKENMRSEREQRPLRLNGPTAPHASADAG